MKRLNAKVVAAVIAIVCACSLFAARVHQVNAEAYHRVEEIHETGERFALDGSFAEYAYENTKEYSLEVTGANIMSCNEYLERYGEDEYEYTKYDDTDRDAPTLVVLDMVIERGGARGDVPPVEELGYLDSLGWSLICNDARNLWLRVDTGLFATSVPQIEGAFQLAVLPGTSFEVHVPFCTTFAKDFPSPIGEDYRPVLEEGAYTLAVTNVPVRHMVEIVAKRFRP